MAVNAGNLILGAGDLYVGAFGATEPADTAWASAPTTPTPWRDMGGTQDGVELAVAQEYTELEVDQLVDVPERRLTKREFTLKTNLAEATLDNLSAALNGNTTITAFGTTTTTGRKLEPNSGTSASQVTYAALIFDGFAPNSKRRRVIGRKMLNTGDVEFAYSKEDQTVLSVEFSGHYVSSSIKPIAIIDGEPV